MPKTHTELLILAMDIGSSSTRTALFDDKARRLSETMASVPYLLRYTSDGGAELSPLVLRRAAQRCLVETSRKHRASPALGNTPVAAIAASSLWHAVLGLDRHGRPITPIFTWADSRAHRLYASGHILAGQDLVAQTDTTKISPADLELVISG